jgi:hypothetical protein
MERWKGKKRRERETVNETKSLCVACKSSLIKVKFVFVLGNGIEHVLTKNCVGQYPNFPNNRVGGHCFTKT